MAWSVRWSREAERRAARHRWDELLPAPGAGLLGPGPDAEESELGPAASLPPRAGEDIASPHRRGRLVPSLRAATALAVVLASGGGLWWWSSAAAEPDVWSVEATADEAAGEGGPTASPGAGGAQEVEPPAAGAGVRHEDVQADDSLVAHVAGAVASPGVYGLPRGARYHEAISAAGGASPDADVHRLNLAAAVEDGMRLYVPRVGEAGDPAAGGAPSPGTGASTSGGSASGAAPAGGAAAAGAKVNLNTATAEELGSLPRVGPVLAQRIVDFRTQHGRFTAPEDLDAVDGIGPKMLEALLPLVTV